MKKNIVKLDPETGDAVDIDVDELFQFIGKGNLKRFRFMRKLINGEEVKFRGHTFYLVLAERFYSEQ